MDPVNLTTHMEIDRRGIPVVHAKGDIDVATSSVFHKEVADAMERSPSVALDLSGVRFMDSSGLSVLVWGVQAAQNSGGRLTIEACSRRVRRLLGITGLDALFDVPAPAQDDE